MRILLIDDEKSIHISTGIHMKLLAEREPVTLDFVSAYSGEEGLAYLEKSGMNVDCIILDSKMPGMSGEQFMEQYKGSVPIIFASGWTSKRPEGVVGVFPKPYSARDLYKAVRCVVKGEPIASPEET